MSNCKSCQQRGTQENDRQIRIDKERRKLVEKKRGKPFTDEEWFAYKMRKT